MGGAATGARVGSGGAAAAVGGRRAGRARLAAGARRSRIPTDCSRRPRPSAPAECRRRACRAALCAFRAAAPRHSHIMPSRRPLAPASVWDEAALGAALAAAGVKAVHLQKIYR